MPLGPDKALGLARDAYTASTTYFDSSIRTGVEAAMRQFRSEHPNGSKYRSDAYASRSKLFRPKTRSMVTRAEAMAAEALFATQDVVSILPWNEDDKAQIVSCDINKALLQYRLTGKHPKRCIPWFVTAIAAYQEAMVNGVICSRQYWQYDKAKKIDRPMVDLVPIENIRFDPSASWVDPVTTSPYWIELVPMYVKDIKAKGLDPNPQKRWLVPSDGVIQNSTGQKFDSTRATREGAQRTDPMNQTTPITEYTIVWVHRNVVEWNGQDYFYYSLGTEVMLSRVMELEEEYWHGRRPYAMGYSAIEAHRNYPNSPVMQTRDLQAEANDVANLRLDNVKFVLNKRYFVRRNAQVDLRSLTRNTIGSATLMKDPEKDVKTVEYSDVTPSSYQEQDRINVDFDDVGGSFSSGSVQTNRKMNETVGGMNLIAADTNQVANYRLRTFVETWLEPVLDQLVQLEQKYETDDVVMAIAGERAPAYIKYGKDRGIDAFLDKELSISVNVGFGPTNPTYQLERFMGAMRQFKEILADSALRDAGIDIEEVKKEIFGKLGYRDGRRFFEESDNPEVMDLKKQIQALTQQLEAKKHPEEIRAGVAKTDAEADKIRAETAKIAAELEAMGQGENPELAATREQFAAAQEEWKQKEDEFTRERDALELRAADKFEETSSRERTETEKARIAADRDIELARIEAGRDENAKKMQDALDKVTTALKALGAEVKETAKATKDVAKKVDDLEHAEPPKETKPATTVLVMDNGAGGAREITLTEGSDGTIKGTIKPSGGK